MPLGGLWFTLGAICVIVALASIYFMWRLRHRAHSMGSFECAYRRDVSAGWTAGVAHYCVERLEWYRVVSLKWGPDRSWDREALEIRSTVPRGGNANSDVLDLHCAYHESHFILAVHRSDYNGLVSWLEGAPPHSEVIY